VTAVSQALAEPSLLVGPHRFEGPVSLRDGSQVTVSPVSEGDEDELLGLLENLCLESRRMRFFSGAVDLENAAHWAALTSAGRYGLIAREESGAVVGHAAYILLDSEHAEVALEVADQLHGRGLGTLLVEHLAARAERHGVTKFVAEVLCENRAMLDVFREGFDARVIRQAGPEQRVEFLTSGWRLARERRTG
jgi:GNAT superfamily N-acetyltransferase